MVDSQFNQEHMLINEQYFTVKKIGEGGFGVVWKAYDFSLRNFVALKELLKDYSEPKFVEMLYREALIAKNIVHDNIVRVQHFWQGSNGSYYLLMDYVQGKDLEHLLSKCNSTNTPLPWELAVLICGSVLKALDYANRLAKDPISNKPYGIVYRDISPGNIIISFDGGVKLSDFGIAKTADEISMGVKQRIVTGKYGYMSPEQTRGDADIDHRSDIFSVGVVLCEMLLGKPLFSGTSKEIKEQVNDIKFDPTAIYNLNVPDELADIVTKALEKDRNNRYEKAIEMFRDLRRLQKGKETEELTDDLSKFVGKLLAEELEKENEILGWVKQLDLQEIKNDSQVPKIACKDFIVGEQPLVTEEPEPESEPQTKTATPPVTPPAEKEEVKVEEKTVPVRKTKPEQKIPTREKPLDEGVLRKEEPKPDLQPEKEIRDEEKPKAEEKGKTVFEEVGDWLVTKFKNYRIRVVRYLVALGIAVLLFLIVDVFAHITSFGKAIYSYLYPPDVVICTVPDGATVSMRSRDGKIILAGKDSSIPIELRKIPPKTYIVTATKEGFRQVERIVRIEDQSRKRNRSEQRIEVFFDFPVVVNSEPKGADVYIDGNKFKPAPWKGELTAGEHTIKLSMEGFEDLGSLAKESKEGQCNIDFTRSSEGEIFSGIDQNFWSYQVSNAGGEKVFNVTGYLFKKFDIDSSPRNIIVHVQSESKPRGVTPLKMSLRSGEYRVRFMDPQGKYEETSRLLNVNKNVEGKLFVSLNKWVTIKVRAKEETSRPLTVKAKLTGSSGKTLTMDVSSTKPLRMAIPVSTYKVSFEGNPDYKPLLIKSVNIAEQTNIEGELEFINPTLKLAIKDEATGRSIPEAFVWIQNQLAGRTDKSGIWENEVRFGTTTIKIVAKGYLDKTVEKNLQIGQREQLTVMLASEPLPVVSTGTVIGTKVNANDEEKPRLPPRKAIIPITRSSDEDQRPIVTQNNTSPVDVKKTTIVCPNCKKEYVVGPKKLRFCTNCGKPFR